MKKQEEIREGKLKTLDNFASKKEKNDERNKENGKKN